MQTIVSYVVVKFSYCITLHSGCFVLTSNDVLQFRSNVLQGLKLHYIYMAYGFHQSNDRVVQHRQEVNAR